MSTFFKSLPLVFSLVAVVPQFAQADNTALADSLAEHMEFSEYGAGILVPEQVPPEELKNYYIIDARDSGQFGKEHLPGAVNIEWREVVARRSEIPTDKPVLFYCNTGTLSSRASFAMRLLGFSNAMVLQEGIEGWKRHYKK